MHNALSLTDHIGIQRISNTFIIIIIIIIVVVVVVIIVRVHDIFGCMNLLVYVRVSGPACMIYRLGGINCVWIQI